MSQWSIAPNDVTEHQRCCDKYTTRSSFIHSQYATGFQYRLFPFPLPFLQMPMLQSKPILQYALPEWQVAKPLVRYHWTMVEYTCTGTGTDGVDSGPADTHYMYGHRWSMATAVQLLGTYK